MTGLDFLAACCRSGVDLPVRIFADSKPPMNFYRPHALSFINIGVEEGDEITGEIAAMLDGMDVSVIAKSLNDQTRSLAKAVLQSRPRHLVVCSGEMFLSWAKHRGWA